MDKSILALGVALIALVLGVASFGNITGYAVTSSNSGGKTDHTPCARECTQICHDGANLPTSSIEELSIDDCITQCLQARCNQKVRAGTCDAFVADDCCNIFADGTDPDCAPETGFCWTAGVACGDPGVEFTCTGGCISTCAVDCLTKTECTAAGNQWCSASAAGGYCGTTPFGQLDCAAGLTCDYAFGEFGLCY